MRLIKLAVISAVMFGVLLFLLSLLLPSKAIVERSGVIDAPMSTVYAQLNDLSKWPAWNPWAADETAQDKQFSNPPTGKGAYFTFSGMQRENRITGKVSIEESRPGSGIRYLMTFNEMRPVNAFFEIKPAADGKSTAIMWRLETHLGYWPWWKLRGFLADRLTGPQLEAGLTKLKTICESGK
ncbi:SRPBCC family protein [Chitinophaga sp.]|uniref:SRPBCC family protein n=1 Tax=Chitinophaga sp. TaxID=1869181 RepID=UPI0031D64006